MLLEISLTSATLTLESYPAVNNTYSLMLFHFRACTLSVWRSWNVALHFKSSKSHILTVLSSDPEAKYSYYFGFSDRHMTASVCVPRSSELNFLTIADLPCLNSSLFSSDPKMAVGSTLSESKFQISISGRKVPTMMWFVFCWFQMCNHSKQSG